MFCARRRSRAVAHRCAHPPARAQHVHWESGGGSSSPAVPVLTCLQTRATLYDSLLFSDARHCALATKPGTPSRTSHGQTWKACSVTLPSFTCVSTLLSSDGYRFSRLASSKKRRRGSSSMNLMTPCAGSGASTLWKARGCVQPWGGLSGGIPRCRASATLRASASSSSAVKPVIPRHSRKAASRPRGTSWSSLRRSRGVSLPVFARSPARASLTSRITSAGEKKTPGCVVVLLSTGSSNLQEGMSVKP
mmetsp:Transcript_27827/g.88376  ORF Transcript_27827/g.88376 Transcript_27827/m.88376 type:complete len:249 (-) Transcript_27827:1187-1933(-)